MDPASALRLLSLSAIWGASFLFMRHAAPVLGPVLLIALRVALAALFLLGVARLLRKPLGLVAHWRHFLILGLFNSALPFVLFAYAALHISASLLSILNATAPIWGVAVGALWSRTAISWRAGAGVLLGIVGVATVAGVETLALAPGDRLAVAAALAASLCYGIASTYAKSAAMARAVAPFANAHGSMWAALLILLPATWLTPLPSVAWDAALLGSVAALGVLCSGVAYLLYFRLIADLGAASALTVTFLIPVFGVCFGHVFLDEPVGWHTVGGAAIVLVGTALVTGFSPRTLFARR